MPQGHLQATGRDARGRLQYRYHAQWRAQRDQHKFHRLADFAVKLPAIRAAVERDLAEPGLTRRKLLAAMVSLLDRTFIRVGDERYRRDNGSFGLTTLRTRHVRVSGDRIRLRFPRQVGQGARRVARRSPARAHRAPMPRPAGLRALPVRRGRRDAQGVRDRRQCLPAGDQRRRLHRQGFPHVGRDRHRDGAADTLRARVVSDRRHAERSTGRCARQRTRSATRSLYAARATSIRVSSTLTSPTRCRRGGCAAAPRGCAPPKPDARAAQDAARAGNALAAASAKLAPPAGRSSCSRGPVSDATHSCFVTARRCASASATSRSQCATRRVRARPADGARCATAVCGAHAATRADREPREQPAQRAVRAVAEVRSALEAPVGQPENAAADGHVAEWVTALRERVARGLAHQPGRRHEPVQRPAEPSEHRDAVRDTPGGVAYRQRRELAFRTRQQPALDEIAQRARRRLRVDVVHAMQHELVAAREARLHRVRNARSASTQARSGTAGRRAATPARRQRRQAWTAIPGIRATSPAKRRAARSRARVRGFRMLHSRACVSHPKPACRGRGRVARASSVPQLYSPSARPRAVPRAPGPCRRTPHAVRHRARVARRDQHAGIGRDDLRHRARIRATTPRPHAIASISTSPNVSWSPACTKPSALASIRASSSDECRNGSIVTFAGARA